MPGDSEKPPVGNELSSLSPEQKDAWKQSKWATAIQLAGADFVVGYIRHTAFGGGVIDLPEQVQMDGRWSGWMEETGFRLTDEEVKQETMRIRNWDEAQYDRWFDHTFTDFSAELDYLDSELLGDE